MSAIKEQLQSARREYHAAKYQGDLADLLPGNGSERSRWILPRAGFGTALAAAAAIVILLGGSAVLNSGNVGAHNTGWQGWVPTSHDLPPLPRRAEMAGAVKTITPPEVPDLLMDVKQPLESSGQFIVNIGKDLAHHADALFHMG